MPLDLVLSRTCKLSLGISSLIALLNTPRSVSGLNWVVNDRASTGRPAIISMSLGGSASTALDNAVRSVRFQTHLFSFQVKIIPF